MSSDIQHIRDLTPDPANARRHNPRNVGMLERSLNEVGAARSIVIDEQGTILAGNATIEAAAQAGITRVQVVEADGETIIAVRRSGLTEEQKTKLVLYDNRVAELAEWDVGVLSEIEPVILEDMFFPHELANILEQGATEILDANELWKGMPEFEQDGVKVYKDLIIHFETREDYEEFARIINRTLTPATKSIWYPDRPEELKGQTSKEIGWTHEP